MLDIGIQVECNGEELARQFRNMTEEAIDGLGRKLVEAGEVVATQAKLLCPVDKGNLRRSIATRLEHNGGNPEVHVGTLMEYAPFVEFGTGIYNTEGQGRQTPWVYRRPDGKFIKTRGNRPQPFLLPAFDIKKSRIERMIGEYLDGVLG